MRSLIISLVVLSTVSCASYQSRNHFLAIETPLTTVVNPYFSDSSKDYIYRADLSIYKRNFSGILILKKTGEAEHRVVFTTEMGNKIFDFTFSNERFTINYILDDIDKEFIINILKMDFKALTQENHSIADSYSSGEKMVYKTVIEDNGHFYFFDSGHKLSKIVRSKKRKEKVIFLFSETTGQNANGIEIIHQNIALSIVLKAI